MSEVFSEWTYLQDFELKEWVFQRKLKGNRLHKDKQYEKAAKIYEEAVAGAKKLGDNHMMTLLLCNLSNTLLQLERPEAAGRLADEALLIDPKSIRAMERKAASLSQLNKLSEARNLIKQALSLTDDPNTQGKLELLLHEYSQDVAKQNSMYKKMIKTTEEGSTSRVETEAEEDGLGVSVLSAVVRLVLIPKDMYTWTTSFCRRREQI
jgi:tetratricopeptide (TPR) repeat protein